MRKSASFAILTLMGTASVANAFEQKYEPLLTIDTGSFSVGKQSAHFRYEIDLVRLVDESGKEASVPGDDKAFPKIEIWETHPEAPFERTFSPGGARVDDLSFYVSQSKAAKTPKERTDACLASLSPAGKSNYIRICPIEKNGDGSYDVRFDFLYDGKTKAPVDSEQPSAKPKTLNIRKAFVLKLMSPNSTGHRWGFIYLPVMTSGTSVPTSRVLSMKPLPNLLIGAGLGSPELAGIKNLELTLAQPGREDDPVPQDQTVLPSIEDLVPLKKR